MRNDFYYTISQLMSKLYVIIFIQIIPLKKKKKTKSSYKLFKAHDLNNAWLKCCNQFGRY